VYIIGLSMQIFVSLILFTLPENMAAIFHCRNKRRRNKIEGLLLTNHKTCYGTIKVQYVKERRRECRVKSIVPTPQSGCYGYWTGVRVE
jgi:hypothetical protein